MRSGGTPPSADSDARVDEILEIMVAVAGAFERIGVPYLIGGSLASSLHGIPRATQDVDIIAQLAPHNVSDFIDALQGGFYLDEAAIRDAVARQASFNVIHLGTYFKADVFVVANDLVSERQLARRQRFALGGDPPRDIVVASAEDVVLQKLRWFQLSDRVSERQWADALGVLRVGGKRLDPDYLREMAALMGVTELLREAWTESGRYPENETGASGSADTT
jgi:hypothetical protein